MPSAVTSFRLIGEFPARAERYPQIRYMGSKSRLLPWIYEILAQLEFETVLDAFSGSGCVSYLLKSMGKQVYANDFLNFAATIGKSTVENSRVRLSERDLDLLLSYDPKHRRFIERKFAGIFFAIDDLRFLDRVWWNIRKLVNPYKRAIAVSALVRSCAKRQPRGLFTVPGDPERYKDGRRDLRLAISAHFEEQVQVYNRLVFDNGKKNQAFNTDVFDLGTEGIDLVYMDPPYVPRADDNCYIKRYHFLEGLSCYWEGLEIMEDSRVKKVKKMYTPFSYRKTAPTAFEDLFKMFSKSTLALSYSSNGYPDLEMLVDLMARYKDRVEVFETAHRYHFGTHKAARRNQVKEYLIIGH